MNIHDSGYKKLFSNQTIFQQLLETFVNQEWVNQLDFSTCETLDKSFISQHYQETESDLIYKVQLLNENSFRSKSPTFMFGIQIALAVFFLLKLHAKYSTLVLSFGGKVSPHYSLVLPTSFDTGIERPKGQSHVYNKKSQS